MADSSRSRARAIVVAAVFIGAAACSKDSSTSSSSRSIVGHVTIDPGEARIPSESFVAGHASPLTPMASYRNREAPRINIVFRSEALGVGRLGAFSVRTVERARGLVEHHVVGLP